MASCTGSPPSPIPLEPPRIESLAQEVHKCVKKDQLVKAKFLLKVISLFATPLFCRFFYYQQFDCDRN